MIVGTSFILTSCSNDSDPIDDLTCSVDAPSTYSFEYEGSSTVYYAGQAARLATAKSLYDAMNADMTVTRAELDALVDNNNSKLYTKTAENDVSNHYDRSVIIGDLNAILDGYAANSAAFEADKQAQTSSASEGVPGLNASGYELDANGWEADQLYAKMLIGALCLEQVNYDYLTKMDVDNTDRTYYNFTNGVANGNDENFTKREHYFDEAYGYVYGLDDDDATAEINNGLLLGKYLDKHDGGTNDNGQPNASGNDWRGDVYNAFKAGRQAIVDNCEDELNNQITIINTTLSNVVAWHAQDYLRASAGYLSTDPAKYFHAVSEAWGFVYSLQFTKMSNGEPLFTHSEVMSMITILENGNGSGNGAYGLDATTLTTMADQISTAMGN